MNFWTAYITAVISWPLIIIIHELGHAIPALFFTKDNVSVYIGSYADPTKNKKIRIGRLNMYFKNNPLLWGFGLCVPGPTPISINKNIILRFSGPVFPLVIALISGYFIFEFNSKNNDIATVSYIFIGLSALGLISNLIPLKTPIKLYSGKIVYNDGMQIWNLLRHKKSWPSYQAGAKLFNEKKYADAVEYFEKAMDSGMNTENIYRLGSTSYAQIKNYQRASELLKKIELEFKLNSDDYCNLGFIQSETGNHIEAIKYYDKSLELNPNNIYSLNNRGFTNGIFEKHQEALKDFDRAIELDPSFANPYDSRGLSRMRLGDIENGLADIYHSLKLDDKNAYGYRNLGIYHFDKKEYPEALKLFEKAKQLNANADKIDYYLSETLSAINNSNKE